MELCIECQAQVDPALVPRFQRHVQINTKIEPDQLSRLQELSARTRVPMSQRVREAIDLVLAKYGGDVNGGG